jgi:hypothetical protein
MSNEIIVGLLSLAGTFIGSYSGMRLMSYRIEQLEKRVKDLENKVDDQNKLNERVSLAERDIKFLYRLSNEMKEGGEK